ncbi:MAG: hypothetical protein KKF56_02100 [Nanoarchaeota archaeon]|nr:hypothetical protein [Nanoarchaeota archaeon]
MSKDQEKEDKEDHEEKDDHDELDIGKSGKVQKSDTEFYVQIAIIAVLALLLMYNIGKGTGGAGGIGTVSASEIIPTGIPAVYGEELGISYDGVSASNPQLADQTIGVLSNVDRTVTLEGDELQRYTTILLKISCEFCCGANSVIFENGQAACGCAHSFAMRGLGKYLIQNHGDEFTDDEILEEIGKWKVLFFPGIHEQKAQVLKEQGIEVNYINLASNAHRGIEKGQASGGGEMVGGC